MSVGALAAFADAPGQQPFSRRAHYREDICVCLTGTVATMADPAHIGGAYILHDEDEIGDQEASTPCARGII
jgi:hypothetical protein